MPSPSMVLMGTDSGLPLLLPAEQAMLPLSRAFRYGDGLFETLLGSSSKVFNTASHFKRLFQGMDILGIPHAGTDFRAQLEEAMQSIPKQLQTPYARIRLQVWREGAGGYLPENEGTAWLIEIYPLDTHPWRDGTGPGLKIGTYPDIPLSYSPLSAVKSSSALPYILAAKFAAQQHWDDALLCSTDGSLAESSNSNLFVLQGNTLLTPPLSSGCLPGTVREAVIAAAASLGLEAQESRIHPDALDQADEVFLTNAIRGLQPVGEVLGTQFRAQNFPVTQKLQGILRQDAVPASHFAKDQMS